jgi:hypothetical protein
MKMTKMETSLRASPFQRAMTAVLEASVRRRSGTGLTDAGDEARSPSARKEAKGPADEHQ